MPLPTISFCMIVKNEALTIRRCLESILPLADEIIVVDTGSTDETIGLCRQLGAKVYEMEWQDDFAAARNESLKRTSSDWIFWIDADEELKLTDLDGLRESISRAKEDVLSIEMIHFYGETPAQECRSYHGASHRLFRSRMGIQFTGCIHEHLDLTGCPASIAEKPLPGAILLHYGYLDEWVESKDKYHRNITLLKRERGRTDNPRLAYHIAGEYYRSGQFALAYQEVNRAISDFLRLDRCPPALVYKLKYELLVNFCPDKASLSGIEKTLLLYPDYVDLHYYRAILLFLQNEYSLALEGFSDCIHLSENPAYLSLTGAGSFLSFFYSGLCCEQLRQPESAKQACRQALALHPDFPEAAALLARLTNPITEGSISDVTTQFPKHQPAD